MHGTGMALSLEEDIKNFFVCIKESYISDCALYQLGNMPSESSASFLPGYINETFSAYTAEERRLAVKLYIRLVSNEYFDAIVTACLECFYPLIQSNLVPAKHVCDELLMSHEEIVKNPVFFREAVQLMNRIVRQVDYKGCRDIFAKALGLYKNFGAGDEQIFLPAFQLINTLMDRSLCLMPAYFALHEVSKLSAGELAQLHPLLRDKLSQFKNSFKDVANMFSHKVLRLVFPVAFVANHCPISPSVPHAAQAAATGASLPVSLLPNSGCLDLKGPLPYDPELQQPHAQLVRAMLAQQGSMDLLLCSLSLHSQSRSLKLPRCHFLERCLIETVLWAVGETETCESDGDVAWCEATWRHLGLASIHLVRNHLVRFPELCLGILEGLQERQGAHSRSAPHIAWMLFNFFGAQNKNPLGDFAPILRILDVLFPEGPKDFDTALLVWYSLTQKSTTSEALPRALPPQLRPMMSQLTDTFHQMSQASAYQVPLAPEEFRWFAYVYNAYAPLAQSLVMSPLNSKLVEALNQPGASALSYASLCQLATMSLIAIDSLLQKMLTSQMDSPGLLETFARSTVLLHHDLNLQAKSVLMLTETFKSPNSDAFNRGNPLHKFINFVVELATYHLGSMEPLQRQVLANNLVSLAKSNRLTVETELCLYRQLQLLLSPALQVTSNHVKKLYVSWICSSDQDELNKCLLLQLCHQLAQQHADPDGALLSDFVQPLFQKCSAACLVPQSMRPHLPPNVERISVPAPQDRQGWQSQPLSESSRLWKRILAEGQCDEGQLGSPATGCLFWVALACLRERPGAELPAAQLFSRVHDALGPRGVLPHLRVFCDLLVLEVAGTDCERHPLLPHVCSLVFAHRLIPLHRLLLTLLLRPFAEARLEVAAFGVLRYLLAADSANSPMAALVPILNSFPPSGGNINLAALVVQLRAAYDDAGSAGGCASPYAHTATRVALVMDTLLARLLQLRPPNAAEVLAVCAPFLRHMPSPGTCLVTLLAVYDPPATLKLQLAARLLGPRMQASPPDAYLPSECLPPLLELLAAGATGGESELQRLSDEVRQLLGPPEAALSRLSAALASYGRRGFPQLDWISHEWPSPLAHAVNCAAVHLLLVSPDSVLASPMPPDTDWQAAGLLLSQMPAPYCHRTVHQPLLSLLDQLGGAPPDQAMGPGLSGRPEVCLWFAYMAHAGSGRLCQLPAFFRQFVRPRVRCEAQMLLACHLVGPLFADLLRSHNSVQNELVAELYQCLAEAGGPFQYQDAVSDYFYHIKYMFVGDGVRRIAAAAIERLSPSMQSRLRSIAPPAQPAECADTPSFPAQQD